jgi:hypothetical protein
MKPAAVISTTPRTKPRAAKMIAPPRIAIQAARLQRAKPEAAARIEALIDELLDAKKA